MYTIDDILELIKQNPDEECEYIELRNVVEIPFADVVYCHGYDELIDLLDDAICEDWLPKFDCNYSLADNAGGGFYYGDLRFEVTILVDIAEFLNEYEEEE